MYASDSDTKPAAFNFYRKLMLKVHVDEHSWK